MSKQNKITSYFYNKSRAILLNHDNHEKKVSSLSKSLKSVQNSKTVSTLIENECIVIDDDDDDFDCKDLNEKDQVINNKSDDPILFNVTDLLKDPEEIFSSKLENLNFVKKDEYNHLDDTTIFLSNLADDFLSNKSLHYLFTVEEIELLTFFSVLSSIDKKKIFARMYWLQWKWYKTSYIIKKYSSDVNNFGNNTIEELINGGLFISDKNMNFDDYVSVLSRDDLIKICKHFKIDDKKSDKETMLRNILKISENKSTMLNHFQGDTKNMKQAVIKMMALTSGKCVKISGSSKTLFDHLHVLMYLGMNPSYIREKQLNLLLMNLKNGKQTFPTANIKIHFPIFIFPSKLFFDKYIEACNLYEQILKITTSPPCNHEAVVTFAKKCYENYKKLKNNEIIKSQCIPPWLQRFTVFYVYIKSLEISIGSFKAMKTANHLNLALSILSTLLEQKEYRQHKRALWYNEKALIVQLRFHQNEEAADILITSLNESEITDDAKAPLKDRAKRLACQKNITLPNSIRETLVHLSQDVECDLPYIEISANSLDDKVPGKKARYIFRDVISNEKVYSSVENYALMHYINQLQYNDGEHWEGRIIVSIFALLFWDIIYSNPKNGEGIFISKFQDSPLDLYSDNFYLNRKDEIDKRLHDIEFGWNDFNQIEKFMHKNYNDGSKDISIMDSNIEWLKINEVIYCLGRNGLCCICKRLSNTFYYAHSGFPDLTVWNSSTKRIKFVEVKGDGDKLSNKQIQWMSYLLNCGIETEVCYVHKGFKKRKIPKKHLESKINPKIETQKKKSRIKDIKIKKDDALNPRGKLIKKKKGKSSTSPLSTTTDVLDKEKNELSDSPLSSTTNVLKKEKNDLKLASNNYEKGGVSKSSAVDKNPSKNLESPKKLVKSKSFSDCYLKSPTKFCKGVGYYMSPTKSSQESPNKSSNSPTKKRLSLSLTRRRIFEKDL